MTEQQTLSDMRNNVVAWPRKDRGFVAMREKSALALAGLSLLLAAWTSRPVSVCCSIAPTLHGVVSLGGRRYAPGAVRHREHCSRHLSSKQSSAPL